MSLSTHLKSSIGEKTLMAVTGVFLLLFVIGHMLGNLQIFVGKEYLNAYAAQLQSLGPLLWAIRLFLLATMGAHVWAAARVVKRSVAARPVKYAMQKDVATNFAAKTMMVSGGLILVFVVYHVLHFTSGNIDPIGAIANARSGAEVDVYQMVIDSFQHLPTTLIYSLSMIVLCLHISHGASSLVQTLGLRRSPKGCFSLIGPALAGFLLVGNLSIPLCIYFGFLS
ncbi:MAG: succinate dehydrogenase cytochrome b subunit [Planctomycetota bacterium]|nr:succinate dehydrogenase cytochrome b subunit [Planctomycetota bacterium]